MRSCTLQKGLKTWKSCDVAVMKFSWWSLCVLLQKQLGWYVVWCVLCFLHVDCQGVENLPQDSADRL